MVQTSAHTTPNNAAAATLHVSVAGVLPGNSSNSSATHHGSNSNSSSTSSASNVKDNVLFRDRFGHMLTDPRRFHAPTSILERVHHFFKGPPHLDPASFEGTFLDCPISVPFPDIMDSEAWLVPVPESSAHPGSMPQFAPVQSCFLHVPVLPSKRRFETENEVILLDDVRLAGQLNAKLWEEFSGGNVVEAITLVPTSATWFVKTELADWPCVVMSGLKFEQANGVEPSGKKYSEMHSYIAVYLGRDPLRQAQFVQTFQDLGISPPQVPENTLTGASSRSARPGAQDGQHRWIAGFRRLFRTQGHGSSASGQKGAGGSGSGHSRDGGHWTPQDDDDGDDIDPRFDDIYSILPPHKKARLERTGRPSDGQAAWHHSKRRKMDEEGFSKIKDPSQHNQTLEANAQATERSMNTTTMTEQTCQHSNLAITIDHDASQSHLSGSGTPTRQEKPGLHGRARIWGPTKTVRMILLTTALMGLQFTWSVEMAYGTPFLLQLGLSKSLMSLVWLAGPLSGWCKDIMTGVFGADYGNLDNATILMAVGSIYILDFAINCVQASCRTLIVDSLPSSQQEAAAAWASRLMGLGGIFGYFMGNVNLPELIPAFGDTQIKGLCVVACIFLILTVGLTCITVTERVMVRAAKVSTSSMDEFSQGFKSIFRAIRYLPTRIQHLCNVQFFAWMGWFPFLFYSSTYIAEIYTQETSQIDPNDPMAQDPGVGVQDAAVRAGSYSLLIYSIVSLIASIMLPLFVVPAESSGTGSKGPFSGTRTESGFGGSKRSSKWWRRWPRWLQLPIRGLTLPRMYTLSLALVSFSLVSTWYVQDLRGSTILFAGCGIAWAVSMWAPFSILGEVISQQMQEELHQGRLRGSVNGTTGAGSAEVLYSKGELDDDEADGEEIGMTEGRSGRQYQPVRLRESMEETFGSMRGRTTTPSPTTVDVPFGPGTESSTWSTPIEYDVGLSKLESESEDSENSEADGEYKKSCKQKKCRSSEEGGSSSPHPGTGSGSTATTAPPSGSSEASSAGALLGIHNIYIVLPQFLVSFLSSLVFAAIEPRTSTPGDSTTELPVKESAGNPDTIGVMLRFGGVMAGIAALLSIRLWKQPRSIIAPSNT
ncbi:hypothetical protein KI688_006266 [Linnemannia hyalina]|uniref:Uncharacterized protein n=1 Tax=Linnemannia hyalina TaxID=64524 RepID=A0A9P7Y5R4_9FUNG|nr:hypothetical protein KI688_006266 [Linnemannia hyalina]